jgi:hypothetical protein
MRAVEPSVDGGLDAVGRSTDDLDDAIDVIGLGGLHAHVLHFQRKIVGAFLSD